LGYCEQAVLLKGRKDIGAIAGSRAANMYGLDVLAEGIQVRFHLHVLEDSAATTF